MCAHAYPRLLVQGNRTDSNTYVTTYNRKIGCHKLFVCFRAETPPPHWAMTSSFTRSLDHTQRRTTVGRTPLDE